MNKEFLKKSKKIKIYFKILKRISKYKPSYRKRFNLEMKYAMKHNKNMMKGGTIKYGTIKHENNKHETIKHETIKYIPPHKRGISHTKPSKSLYNRMILQNTRDINNILNIYFNTDKNTLLSNKNGDNLKKQLYTEFNKFFTNKNRQLSTKKIIYNNLFEEGEFVKFISFTNENNENNENINNLLNIYKNDYENKKKKK